MKLRSILDILLVTVFLLGAGYALYTYMGEENNTAELRLPGENLSSNKAISEKDPHGYKFIQAVNTIRPADPAAEWYPETLSNRWKYINIFQNNQLSGNSKTLLKHYPNKRFSNIADFHFIINNGYGAEDGLIEVTPLWKLQQDSTLPIEKDRAHQSINICFIGDFTVQPPTEKQLASFKALLNYLFEATTVKTYNTIFRQTGSSENNVPPFFPLNEIIKTRY